MFNQMPEIHVCSRLTDENEQLIKKMKKLKKKNNALEEELRDINEKLKFEEFIKHHTLKLSVCTQTDLPGYKPLVIKPKQLVINQRQKHTDEHKKQIDSLLKMHKNLMKKYQKELKHNAKHLEIIAGLNLRVQDLETQLNSSKQKVEYLERNHSLTPSASQRKMRRTPRSHSRRRASSTSPEDLKSEVNQLRLEREKLFKERKLMKKELGALDDDFFEEIEDLKYALQQSAKLNKEYQKTLEKLSQQFGFPLPNMKAKYSGRRGDKKNAFI